MNIGIFTKKADGTLTGDLPSLHLNGVSFEPVTQKGNGPDYRATIEGAELGAAWKKTSGKGNEYLSVQIDSPAFPAPINFAVFARKEGNYVADWSRAKPKDDEQTE
jgi:uncharacterized protein (DUF736 family)